MWQVQVQSKCTQVCLNRPEFRSGVSDQRCGSEVWIGPLAFAARSRAGSSTKGKQRTSSIHEVVSSNILLRSDTVARGRGDEARVRWSGPESGQSPDWSCRGACLLTGKDWGIKGWDCSLNLWVVPPHVYMSQFTSLVQCPRWTGVPGRCRSPPEFAGVVWDSLASSGMMRTKSETMRTSDRPDIINI